MIRSGLIAIVVFTVASQAILGVVVLLFLESWLPASLVGGLVALGFVVAALLLRRADPEEMKARAARAERVLDAWGRGMAKASGGWTPRSRRP